MKKLVLVFVIMSAIVLGNDYVIQESFVMAGLGNESYPAFIKFAVDDELFIKGEDTGILIRYGDSGFLLDFDTMNYIITKATEWDKVAKENNVVNYKKEIVKAEITIFQDKEVGITNTPVKYGIIQGDKGLDSFVYIEQAEAIAIDYSTVYSPYIIISMSEIEQLMNKLNGDGLEELKAKLQQNIDKRNQQDELFK